MELQPKRWQDLTYTSPTALKEKFATFLLSNIVPPMHSERQQPTEVYKRRTQHGLACIMKESRRQSVQIENETGVLTQGAAWSSKSPLIDVQELSDSRDNSS
jgi:hypothetical protein